MYISQILNKEVNLGKSTNLLKTMNDESNCIETIFMEFAQDIDSNNIYCFFEGQDFKYYCPRIENFINEKEKIIAYDCKGKENVLSLHSKINNNTNNRKKTLFFIDNDFDYKKINHSEIYVTPCYSIENFYIEDKTIENFLRGEFNLYDNIDEKSKKDFLSALNYFKEERKKFIKDIELLNAWYSLQHNLFKESIGIKYPNLEKLKDIKSLSFPITIEMLKEKTPNYIKFTNEALDLELFRLQKNPIKLFRGKYFTTLICRIINFLISKEAVTNDIFSRKRSISISVAPKNVVSVLSQYAITPQCLKTYIKDRLSLLDKQSSKIV